MSERTGTGGGMMLGGVALLGLLGFAMFGGQDIPEQCDKPAPNTCYTVATTLVPPVGGEVDNTTAMPTEGDGDTVPATVVLPAPSTAKPVEDTTQAPARPNSEAAPKPTDPPVTEPPATEPPATEPPQQGVDTSKCGRTTTVRSGDSWVSIADRADVWTRDLLALNQATKETPLYVGLVVCLPPSVYGDGDGTVAPNTSTPVTAAPPTPPSATEPPATEAPTTLAPQAPPTQPATTTTVFRGGSPRTTQPAPPAPTTEDQRKLAPEPPKQPQDVPKLPQQPPVIPTTTKPTIPTNCGSC